MHRPAKLKPPRQRVSSPAIARSLLRYARMNETAPSPLNAHYDTDKQTLTLTTPGGCRIVISDTDGSITLNDAHDNTVSLGRDGISLASSHDLHIRAAGKLVLSAGQHVEIDAAQDLRLDGLNINLDAKISLDAQGNASAALHAAGQTTIKGALVMIN